MRVKSYGFSKLVVFRPQFEVGYRSRVLGEDLLGQIGHIAYRWKLIRQSLCLEC